MKTSQLIGVRFKERPADCVIDSHALTVRGGYAKQVGSGVYSLLPPMRRVTQKVERIIREEMDKTGGQEVLFPVVMPASLWEESGRYSSVGDELARFKDRNGAPMVLGMTHEEAAVHLAREFGRTYSNYPFMIYQIQTKFRDEPRPRAGMIRVREFTMKDAYSFHTSQEDLERYYEIQHEAYVRIFKRCGLRRVVSVASDSGMMGGKVAHEFMLLTPAGEDSIATCACGYHANVEVAPCIVKNAGIAAEPLALRDTPGASTIDEVAAFFGASASDCCKAVLYRRSDDNTLVVVFIRGDIEVNEIKLQNHLKTTVYPAVIEESDGICAGFVGPKGLPDGVSVLFDGSLEGANRLIAGGNEIEKHYTGFNLARDYGTVEFRDIAKAHSGSGCPKCGGVIEIERGIEVGNIFQLGTKYSKAMDMQYLDEKNELHDAIMGCYGIGVGRTAASVMEESRDDYGPIWPITIAPWQVQLCCLRAADEVARSAADSIYKELQAAGIEVLYDDREVSAGVMFSDADLLGLPVRIVVSPRGIAEGAVELKTRNKSVDIKIAVGDVTAETEALIARLTAEIEG